MEFETPYGPRKLVYADYVASGRALRVIEEFVLDRVLPIYANSHSEASFCGASITRMREAGREAIAQICGADDNYATIFTGSGATSALNRTVALLGVTDAIANGRAVQVFIGPYEHHSNILPWRESGAEVIEIPEAPMGGPDMAALATALQSAPKDALKIGSFSAASNVSGILTDTEAVTRLSKSHAALAVWDYAGAGPYIAIDMGAGTDAQKDAVVVSPHKFIGGPGASGLLFIHKSGALRTTPSQPGGGTVRFVSPWGHDYATDLVAREEAGTPNVIGDIRAALAFMVKDAIGQDYMNARHAAHLTRARAAWAAHPEITILGNPNAPRLPIFSLLIHTDSGTADPQDFTRALSDNYGIQARGGCACAGPYGHRLLSIDRTTSDQMRAAILSGDDSNKPGFTRLNFSALMTDEKADFIIEAVAQLATHRESLRHAG
ncbi:MAG: aminotransferase class V-fold PLP-dependent enzyme [Cypionkella sp.]